MTSGDPVVSDGDARSLVPSDAVPASHKVNYCPQMVDPIIGNDMAPPLGS
jgi:hypothetical protein